MGLRLAGFRGYDLGARRRWIAGFGFMALGLEGHRGFNVGTSRVIIRFVLGLLYSLDIFNESIRDPAVIHARSHAA